MDFKLKLLRISVETDVGIKAFEACESEKSGNGGYKFSWDDVSVECQDGGVYLTATESRVRYIRLYYENIFADDTYVLFDAWERTYGDLCWQKLSEKCGKLSPWYCQADDGAFRYGLGVEVRPNAFCYWKFIGNEIELSLNVCNGPEGVALKGRRLFVAKPVFYKGAENRFSAGRAFCRLMANGSGIFPKHKVYGTNNWYYAYGKSTEAETLCDAEYLKELTEGLANRPYLVLDDCWEENVCAGPWDHGNADFPDMKGLCERIKAMDLHAGIWIRPLHYKNCKFPKEWILREEDGGVILDVSVSEAKKYVIDNFRLMKEWGFELVKYDFSFVDMLGNYGFAFDAEAGGGKFCFADRSKTTAEIMRELYRDIKAAVGDTLLIGCNTAPHFVVGYVELNRIGEDTSGIEWERTRKMGVNTIACRLIQNGVFYAADGDCVGLTEKVPWEKNREWLRLLSLSNSPLFVSSKKGVANAEQIAALKQAFINNNVEYETEPIIENDVYCPTTFLVDGKETKFDW